MQGGLYIRKVEFDQIMNIDLNYAKNNDSISVEETFKTIRRRHTIKFGYEKNF